MIFTPIRLLNFVISCIPVWGTYRLTFKDEPLFYSIQNYCWFMNKINAVRWILIKFIIIITVFWRNQRKCNSIFHLKFTNSFLLFLMLLYYFGLRWNTFFQKPYFAVMPHFPDTGCFFILNLLFFLDCSISVFVKIQNLTWTIEENKLKYLIVIFI